jgi:hypothetical protein
LRVLGLIVFGAVGGQGDGAHNALEFEGGGFAVAFLYGEEDFRLGHGSGTFGSESGKFG